MKHRHGAAELLLNRWGARNREAHLAELCRIARWMFVLSKGR
jgi:hypothetical protein